MLYASNSQMAVNINYFRIVISMSEVDKWAQKKRESLYCYPSHTLRLLQLPTPSKRATQKPTRIYVDTQLLAISFLGFWLHCCL